MSETVVEKIDYSKTPVVLSASHVSKCFKLPTEQATGLKQAFINWTKGIKGYRKQEVLKDISFEVHQGEFFGIVGRNGGGKSTLLKLISQIYYPESGSISVNGKLVPFIELESASILSSLGVKTYISMVRCLALLMKRLTVCTTISSNLPSLKSLWTKS